MAKESEYIRCNECGSEFLKSSSQMMALCPECAHILYGYPNCDHVFKNGRCIYCHWDGSRSDGINWLLSGDDGTSIKSYEPLFFISFGLFHLHRIWGLIDRKAYADFWIGILNEKGILYYSIMGILAFLCVLGIITFFRNLHNNYWWRFIYLFGGAYVLFDLFAIATEMRFWYELLLKMFDISSPYWNIIWLTFVLLGGAVFVLGIVLLKKLKSK